MNYLQRKKLALMMNRKFKGYLRTVSGVPLTLTDCIGSELVSLSVVGNADGVGERTANLFDVNGDINRRADDSIIVSNMYINVFVEGDKINIHCSGSAYYGVGQWISVEIGKTYTYSYTLLNIGEAGGVYVQAMYPDTWTGIAIATVRQEGENGIASFTAEQDKVMFCFNKTVGSPAYDTGTIIGNIMFVEGEYTAETLPEYEPYGYKIPLTVSGENENKAYNIYSDTPLYGTEGEEYTVPVITTFKGTTIITPETSVQPTSMMAEYYARKP